ncbi:MAG: TetR family transcriptional regulator [Myxococcales bacterium]|nr:TetR family transcriptional regulator [Myxococcales bacterium]
MKSTTVYKRARPASAPRERNADATRSAILQAARKLFTRDGMGVGVRELAEEAGVNVALVNRYFGSKEELFAQAVGDDFDLSPLLEGPRREFGLRLARYALNKPRDAHDPILVLLRSASHPFAIARFRRIIDERFVTPLAAWLDGPNARARAAAIAAELLGLATLRDVVGNEDLPADDAVIAVVARAIQAHVAAPPSSDG